MPVIRVKIFRNRTRSINKIVDSTSYFLNVMSYVIGVIRLATQSVATATFGGLITLINFIVKLFFKIYTRSYLSGYTLLVRGANGTGITFKILLVGIYRPLLMKNRNNELFY